MISDEKVTPRIPVATAKMVAEKHSLSQVILIGWDGKLTHIVTYGKTKVDCEDAAKAQEFWAGHIREFSFRTADAPEIAAAEIRGLEMAKEIAIRRAKRDDCCVKREEEAAQIADAIAARIASLQPENDGT